MYSCIPSGLNELYILVTVHPCKQGLKIVPEMQGNITETNHKASPRNKVLTPNSSHIDVWRSLETRKKQHQSGTLRIKK